MVTLKYQVKTLITLVESKPILWDKTLAVYGDKISKRNAWEEIFGILEPTYHKFAPHERAAIGNSIILRWRNIKDSYLGSLKYKNREKRRDLYSEHLLFLLKLNNCGTSVLDCEFDVKDSNESGKIDTKVSLNKEKRKLVSEEDEYIYQETDHGDIAFNIEPKIENTSIDDDPLCEDKNEKRTMPQSNREPNPFLDEQSDVYKLLISHEEKSKPRDEDECFLFSILPFVQQLSENNKFDFRVEVMALLRKYRERSKTIDVTVNETPTSAASELNCSLPGGVYEKLMKDGPKKLRITKIK